jgi:hypothetical protein
MSVFQRRLSVITDTVTSLNIRMRELERLRDQVKRAQLLARKSRPTPTESAPLDNPFSTGLSPMS